MWLRKNVLVVDSQEFNKLINKENLLLPLHACGELLGYNACAKLLNLRWKYFVGIFQCNNNFSFL